MAVFRFLFGFIMLVSIIRFSANGWIYDLYVKPDFFFTYYGFDWVTPPGEVGMYLLFLVMGLAAGSIMLGYYYRIGIILFFLTFTYVELIDKTNYLNHYYFVSIISFLLMFVPAHCSFSLDALRKPSIRKEYVPAWTINIFKLQLGIVYFFAGVAKLNPDWLLNAMPLRIWLPANSDLPIVGPLLEYTASAYIFSWAGAFYDLTIAFFLLWKRTRILAYIAVIGFHMFTWFLFQIGMFPFIMILCTLIFFPAEFHKKIIHFISGLKKYLPFSLLEPKPVQEKEFQLSRNGSSVIGSIIVIHFVLQLLLPLRFMLYPGNLFWTQEGFRFSWRVMLTEKAGYITFNLRNPETGNEWQARNWDHLTPEQEKEMSTRPDMILQFAHYLEDEYQETFSGDVEVTVESKVTLNGRRSQPIIDPTVDLTEQERGLTHKEWILPLNENQPTWFSTQQE
ncbi:HTTM domain-containing protein [Fodinibius sp.]|uniref:HTTM domain-containing protein n=1 Tax=Fodinibius sp. TaxID=1872440 RepID=UPI003561C53A